MQEGRWTTITPSQFTHEREALAHVQALLPDTEPYRAWSNFTFTAQTGHPYEVDLLVAAPGGLYLIEIKSLNGRLISSGSNWILQGPSGSGTRTFDNPLHLADMKAKKLKSLLQVAATQRKGPPVRIPFVQAAVFLSKPGLHVGLSDHHLHNIYGPEPAAGHQPGPLPTITSLLQRPPQDERQRVTKKMSAALPDLLNAVGIARSRKHYQIGSWELETRPFDVGPTWQDHQARHRDLERERRRVRIYLVERNAVQTERAREPISSAGVRRDGWSLRRREDRTPWSPPCPVPWLHKSVRSSRSLVNVRGLPWVVSPPSHLTRTNCRSMRSIRMKRRLRRLTLALSWTGTRWPTTNRSLLPSRRACSTTIRTRDTSRRDWTCSIGVSACVGT
jgi:hypothetical protein